MMLSAIFSQKLKMATWWVHEPIPNVPPFPGFSESILYQLPIEYLIHIWHASPQFSCDEAFQIYAGSKAV